MGYFYYIDVKYSDVQGVNITYSSHDTRNVMICVIYLMWQLIIDFYTLNRIVGLCMHRSNGFSINNFQLQRGEIEKKISEPTVRKRE